MKLWRIGGVGAVIIIGIVLASACTNRSGAASPPAAIPLQQQQLNSILAQLAKGHSDKTKLSFYISMPLMKKTDPAVRAFSDRMGARHKELLKELQAYAKTHGISLNFDYDHDVLGQAQKLMEDEQSRQLQAAGKDFELLMLTLEYSDFEWQKNLIKATLQQSNLDPNLKAYLEKSLKAHEEGLGEIQGLLKRFEFK